MGPPIHIKPYSHEDTSELSLFNANLLFFNKYMSIINPRPAM